MCVRSAPTRYLRSLCPSTDQASLRHDVAADVVALRASVLGYSPMQAGAAAFWPAAGALRGRRLWAPREGIA